MIDFSLQNFFVFDVDSTAISVESFDEILISALKNDPHCAEKKRKIEAICSEGMNGNIPLSESLSERLKLSGITQKHIDDCTDSIEKTITAGIPEIIRFLQKNGQEVFLISGGFLEVILPVGASLNIPPDHCYGNTFKKSGELIVGIDFTNPLAKNGGKGEVISRHLRPKTVGKIIVIGDGMSDAETLDDKNGADEFWGFFQNVSRDAVRVKATRSFDTARELLKYLYTASDIAPSK